MDRLLAMTVFAQVVELGGFARAAERLEISTSAASRYLAELEAHLQTRLLHRTTRKLSLTESGREYYERCVQLLADLDEAERSAGAQASDPRGTLRVTCSLNFAVRHLAPAISAFTARHPSVKFDVSLSERIVDLVDEGFDLAIRVGTPGGQQLIARKIGESRLVACASPGYLAKHGIPRTPADLRRHNCLLYENLAPRDTWAFRDRHGKEHAVRVTGNLHSTHGDMLVAAATRDMGIALEPDFIVEPELKSGRLVAILERFAARRSSIYAVYPSRRHLSAKVRLFVDFLMERCSSPR